MPSFTAIVVSLLIGAYIANKFYRAFAKPVEEERYDSRDGSGDDERAAVVAAIAAHMGDVPFKIKSVREAVADIETKSVEPESEWERASRISAMSQGEKA